MFTVESCVRIQVSGVGLIGLGFTGFRAECLSSRFYSGVELSLGGSGFGFRAEGFIGLGKANQDSVTSRQSREALHVKLLGCC